MNIFPWPTLCAFVLIVITGTLTSFSDIRERKIKNLPLLIITGIALSIYIPTFLFLKTSWTLQILSALVAIIISAILFFAKMWRAGDAKLFIVYSLLMPQTGYEQLLLLPCFPLFINTFSLSLFFLTPLFIMYIIIRRNDVVRYIFSKEMFNDLIRSFLIILSISWITYPLIAMTGLQSHTIISAIIIYISSFLIYHFAASLRKYPIAAIFIFIAGLGLRAYVSPSFFTIKRISYFILITFVYSFCFQVLQDTITKHRSSKDRVPFAPFLFLGCLLSYFPFLTWLLKLFHR